MKKFAAFAVVVCLLALAVAAVVAVNYPDKRQPILDAFQAFGAGVVSVAQKLLGALRAAFAHG